MKIGTHVRSGENCKVLKRLGHWDELALLDMKFSGIIAGIICDIMQFFGHFPPNRKSATLELMSQLGLCMVCRLYNAPLITFSIYEVLVVLRNSQHIANASEVEKLDIWYGFGCVKMARRWPLEKFKGCRSYLKHAMSNIHEHIYPWQLPLENISLH